MIQGTHKKNFSPKFPCPSCYSLSKLHSSSVNVLKTTEFQKKRPIQKIFIFERRIREKSVVAIWDFFCLRYSIFSNFYDVYGALRIFNELLWYYRSHFRNPYINSFTLPRRSDYWFSTDAQYPLLKPQWFCITWVLVPSKTPCACAP